MTTGLPVDRLISVNYTFTSAGAQFANVNSLVILGPSAVIPPGTMEEFASLDEVGGAFGDDAPEYLACVDYFGQSPQPNSVNIGGWAQDPSPSQLVGVPIPTNTQPAALTALQAVTTGALAFEVDGHAEAVSALSLASATNFNQVASLINGQLAYSTIAWNGSNFVVVSDQTGASSSINFPTVPDSGTNLAPLLFLNSAQGATIIDGIAAQSPLQAIQAIDDGPGYAYGVMFAPNPEANITDEQYEAVAAYIEGDASVHVFGITTQEAETLVPGNTSSLAYSLAQLDYQRTFVIYSSTDPNAVAAMFGVMVGVNWQGSNTAINFMYQSLVGIEPETLTTQQAGALDAVRCNYSAEYANGVAILENGVMSGPYFIDEITGADAYSNEIQTNVFNVLATAGTKVAQTDAGQHLLGNGATVASETFVANGFIAPGVWNAAGFGALNDGDYLSTGYYIYQPPVASQATEARAARQSVNFQIAAKLAGATNTANLALTFNR